MEAVSSIIYASQVRCGLWSASVRVRWAACGPEDPAGRPPWPGFPVQRRAVLGCSPRVRLSVVHILRKRQGRSAAPPSAPAAHQRPAGADHAAAAVRVQVRQGGNAARTRTYTRIRICGGASACMVSSGKWGTAIARTCTRGRGCAPWHRLAVIPWLATPASMRECSLSRLPPPSLRVTRVSVASSSQLLPPSLHE
jgi:hypothetical protein